MKKILFPILATVLIAFAIMPLTAGKVNAAASPTINAEGLTVAFPDDQTTLAAGDKFTLSVEVSDPSGVKGVIYRFKKADGGLVFNQAAHYNDTTGRWEAEVVIGKQMENGPWVLHYVEASNTQNQESFAYNKDTWTLDPKYDFSACNFTVERDWVITFDANGGTGEMDPVSKGTDGKWEVPKCTFTAPEYPGGEVFYGWNTVAVGTPENWGTWYYPGEKINLEDDLTLYARWSEPALSLCSYDNTNSKSSQGGQFKIVEDSSGWYDRSLSYGCSNYTVSLDDEFTVAAYPDNGYEFVGWYDGKYIHKDSEGNPVQDAEPYMDQKLSAENVYKFTVTDNTVLCPVFKEADEVHFVDIGNIWTKLDPINEAAYTAETNPNVAGLSNYIEIADETWTCADGSQVLKRSDETPGKFIAGKTYSHSVVIKTKGDNVFVPSVGFRFIYGGTEYEWDNIKDKITFSEDYKTAEVKGLVPDQTIAKVVQTVTLPKTSYTKTFGNAAFSLGAKTDGDGALTYSSSNAKVAAVSTAGRVTIKGAGKATITVYAEEGTNYNESAKKNVTVTVNKAANALKIKAKTATVKGSTKGKKGTLKKTKTLGVTKVIKFTSKGQGAKTYVKKSGNAKITIAKKTGKVTVKKGLKKGTYKVKVKVKAAGTANYKASAWKVVTFTVTVR